MEPVSQVKQSKELWAILKGGTALLQVAAWILGTMAGFLLLPTEISREDEKAWLKLAPFVIAVVLGLMVIAARRWSPEKHLGRWWFVAIALFIFSISGFIGYGYLSYSWTCKYNNQTLIIGTSLTDQGRYYVRQNPGISCEDLLMDFAGKVEDIWTKESINRCRILLAGIYINLIPIFAMSMISVIQVIHITNQKNKGQAVFKSKEDTKFRSAPFE
jgi:hypothetical protein